MFSLNKSPVQAQSLIGKCLLKNSFSSSNIMLYETEQNSVEYT
jgi:hypothetical protein